MPVIGYQEVIQGLSRDDVYAYYKLAYQPLQAANLVKAEAYWTIADSNGKANVLLEPYTDSPSTLSGREMWIDHSTRADGQATTRTVMSLMVAAAASGWSHRSGWTRRTCRPSAAQLTGYLLTQTNVIAAVENGSIPIGEAADWILKGVEGFFGGEKRVMKFSGTICYLRRA